MKLYTTGVNTTMNIDLNKSQISRNYLLIYNIIYRLILSHITFRKYHVHFTSRLFIKLSFLTCQCKTETYIAVCFFPTSLCVCVWGGGGGGGLRAALAGGTLCVRLSYCQIAKEKKGVAVKSQRKICQVFLYY